MKYVRTKDDKIIKIDEKGCIKVFNNKLYAFRDKTFAYRYENGREIIEEADTIEELCDVIVETKGATGDYKHYIYEGERYEKLKPKIIDDIRTQDFNVYAGIWTDKGLIYVAKMNDKGELELL